VDWNVLKALLAFRYELVFAIYQPPQFSGFQDPFPKALEFV